MSVSTENSSLDYADKSIRESYQLDQLQRLFAYLNKHSKYYQSLFAEHGITGIDSLEDLKNIPTTIKKQLAEHPQEFLAVPTSHIAEFTTTSGTIGNPVQVCLTANDIQRLAHNEASSLAKAGCTADDIFQLAVTMDKRFMAGLAYAEGVRKLGAGLVRVGASSPALHWDSIIRFKPTVIIAIPTFILSLIDYAKANNIDYRNSSLKKVIAIGQPLRNEDLSLNVIGQKIQDLWGIDCYSTYASTEMASAFTECEQGQGGHLQPDLVYLEVLDKNDEPVQNGEQGEIVISTFGVEAMPLLRYRTGDIARRYTDTCGCGRTTERLGPIIGRKNQMIKYKGTTVHPSSLIPLLDAREDCKMSAIVLSTDELGLDDLTLVFSEDLVNEESALEIIQEMADSIKVKPKFVIRPAVELKKMLFDPSSRKPLRIIDKRS